MKRLMLMVAIAFIATGCNGQQEENNAATEQQNGQQEKVANKPKVKWDVKKEMDENGNVIRYDSTYSWSYTNIDGDSVMVSSDSIMNSFHSYFNEKFPPIWGGSFAQPLMADSLLYKDFYQDDYFHSRWQQDFFKMDKMFRKMDSMRNQFFYEQYPGMLMPPEEDKDKK